MEEELDGDLEDGMTLCTHYAHTYICVYIENHLVLS